MDCTASTKPLYAGNFPLPSLTNNINENIQTKKWSSHIKYIKIIIIFVFYMQIGINSKLSQKIVRTSKGFKSLAVLVLQYSTQYLCIGSSSP